MDASGARSRGVERAEWGGGAKGGSGSGDAGNEDGRLGCVPARLALQLAGTFCLRLAPARLLPNDGVTTRDVTWWTVVVPMPRQIRTSRMCIADPAAANMLEDHRRASAEAEVRRRRVQQFLHPRRPCTTAALAPHSACPLPTLSTRRYEVHACVAHGVCSASAAGLGSR